MNNVSRRSLLRGLGLASLGVVASTRGSRTAMAVSDWEDTSLTYESSDGTIPQFELTSDDITGRFSWSNFSSDGGTVDVDLQARLPNREDSASTYSTVLSGAFPVTSASGSNKPIAGDDIIDAASFPVSIFSNTPIQSSHFSVPTDQTETTTAVDFRIRFTYNDESVIRETTCAVTVIETTSIPEIGDHQWYADEGTGTTLTDALGSVSATVYDATWRSDSTTVGGQFLEYDGSNDYTQTDTSINGAQDTFTVFGWARPRDYTNFGNVFCGSATAGSDYDPGWYLFTNGTEGKIGAVAGAASFLNGTPFVPTGEWGFMAAIYDGSSARLLTFDNSQELADVSGTGQLRSPQTGDPLEFGRDPDGGKYFAGDLDLWGFSASKLSKQDIVDVWEATQR